MKRGPVFMAALAGSALLSLLLTRAPGSQPVASNVGSEACKECHEDQYASWQRTVHGRAAAGPEVTPIPAGCESCHGPGSLHAAAGGDEKDPGFKTIRRLDRMTADASSQVCQQCHSTGDQFFWESSTHAARGIACVKCHSAHAPKDPGGAAMLTAQRPSDLCQKCHLAKKFNSSKSAHMPIREGGMECTGCHTPHGSAAPKMLKAATINETCEPCHADKRGPFLWEHAPVRENCANCHEPHGANNDKLLTSRRPLLCQKCHVMNRHPASLYDFPDLASNRLNNRSCTNCHSQIHGSNHPSGNWFFR